MNLRANPTCPRCGQDKNFLWRCETAGEWKDINLCFNCCNSLMVEASLTASKEIAATDKDVLHAIAQKDMEDLYGGKNDT